jgi:hypothetical protein
MNFDVIIDKFTIFKNIEFIQVVQYSPDTILTLLNIDGKKYVLVETDYFNDYYENMHIKEAFNLEVEKWLRPIVYSSKEYDAPAYYNKETNIAYGLAVVKGLVDKVQQ